MKLGLLLTDLLARHLPPPPPPVKEGVCVFCGRAGKGYPAEFPETFTTFDRATLGDIICTSCWAVFKSPEIRRNSWVVNPRELRFLRKNEIVEVLRSPPEPPFSIYITKSRRKHGWLFLMDKVNFSREAFFVGFDESVVFIVRDEFLKLMELVGRLRKKGVPKSEILSGMFSARSFCKADPDEIEEVRKYARSPVLELALFLS